MKIISEDYGVATVETNPSQETTQHFIDLIKPQIKSQLFKENSGIYANEMFHFGLRWGRKTGMKSPVKIDSFAGKSDYYAYDTLDQNGNKLPSLKELEPIINEIEKFTGFSMKNYDSMIGNIYLDNQFIYPHKDTTESKSARTYPVIVYTIGNNSSLGIVDNNQGKMSFHNKYNTQFLPSSDKLKGYTNEILTKNGTIYCFGIGGKGRFELTHSTPINNKKKYNYPPIELPNGDIIGKYTITLTFRRAQDI